MVAKARWIAAERRASTCAPTNGCGGLAGERQSRPRAARRHRYGSCWCPLVPNCTVRVNTALLTLVHARPSTAAGHGSFIAVGAGAKCRVAGGRGQREETFGVAHPRRRAVGRPRSRPGRSALIRRRGSEPPPSSRWCASPRPTTFRPQRALDEAVRCRPLRVDGGRGLVHRS